jgi:hypothetical protein
MTKLYSTPYTDEDLTFEEFVTEENRLLGKFKGIETLEHYYFTLPHIDMYVIEKIN